MARWLADPRGIAALLVLAAAVAFGVAFGLGSASAGDDSAPPPAAPRLSELAQPTEQGIAEAPPAQLPQHATRPTRTRAATPTSRASAGGPADSGATRPDATDDGGTPRSGTPTRGSSSGGSTSGGSSTGGSCEFGPC